MKTLEEIVDLIVTKQIPLIHKSDCKYFDNINNQILLNQSITTYQFKTCLFKIKKNQLALEHIGIDVESFLKHKFTSLTIKPMEHRKIIDIDPVIPAIKVSFCLSKTFDKTWAEISKELKISRMLNSTKNEYLYGFYEHDFIYIVNELIPLNFKLTDIARNIYDECNKVVKNQSQYHISIDDNYNLVNIHPNALCHFNQSFGKITQENCHLAVQYLKKLGYFITYNQNNTFSNLTDKILRIENPIIRINPNDYSIDELVTTLAELNSWPVLFLLDEANSTHLAKQIHTELQKFISNEEITVFFRPNHDPNKEFSSYIRNNNLNNYIDEKIKVVFIVKNKIPKPLCSANWKPSTAVVLSMHNFGKVESFLNDIPMLYYYNDSIIYKSNKIKEVSSVL